MSEIPLAVFAAGVVVAARRDEISDPSDLPYGAIAAVVATWKPGNPMHTTHRRKLTHWQKVQLERTILITVSLLGLITLLVLAIRSI